MEFIVMCLGILAGMIGLVLAIDSIRMYERKRQELEDKNEELANKNQELAERKKEPPTVDEAIEALADFCKSQKGEIQCPFNTIDSTKECSCRLLKDIPEDWKNANHKERP